MYDTAFEDGGKTWAPGVYLHGIKEKTNRLAGETTIRLIDRWICSVVRVKAITRTTEDKEHSYLLEFVPHGKNVIRSEVIPQSLLVGRITDLMQFLRPLAMSVLYENGELVRDYLDHEHKKFSAEHPEHFLESVKVVGWHSPGKTFILPTEIIGERNGVWFDGKNVALYGKGGDFDTWKNEVATPCEGNSYLVLGFSCAFAGPLLEPLNIPGLGIHYFGVSTTGKSTALAVAASAWGQEKFAISWSATINGLEAAAMNRSSTLLVLDESHQVDPKVLDGGVYLLLNRTGKATMNKDRSAREIARWYPCLFSSGERSVETHQTTAKIEHKVGQALRIVDVPVVFGPHGLFTDIHGAKNGAKFSDRLRTAAGTHYGYAGPVFIEHLIKDCAELGLAARRRLSWKNSEAI